MGNKISITINTKDFNKSSQRIPCSKITNIENHV